MSHQNKYTNINTSGQVNTAFVVLLGLIVAGSVFFKGLYFEQHFLYVEAALMLLVPFFVFKVVKKEQLPQGIMEWGIIGLIVAYVLSTIVSAANIGESVAITARLITYVLFYLMISRSLTNLKDIRLLLILIYGSAVITAVAGLGAYYRIWDFQGAIFKGDRIASFFQYPNTTASFLLVAFIVGIYLFSIIQDSKFNYLIGIGNSILLITFLGTKSRAAFLVFPIALIIYLVVQKDKRTNSFFAIINNTIPPVLLTPWLLAVSNNDMSGYVKFFILVLVTFLINISYRLKIFNSFKERIFKSGRLSIAVLLVVIILLGIYITTSENAVFAKLSSINLGERTLNERAFFYEDALKIIKDYPFIGTGGGGWQSLYTKYQSYSYSTNVVHNFFLQTVVETGIIGMIFLVVLYVGLLMLFARTRIYLQSEDKSALSVIFTAFSALTLHSFLDFNMSFGAIGLVFWTMLGMMQYFYLKQNNMVQPLSATSYSKYVVIGISLALSVLAITSSISLFYAQKGVMYKEENRLQDARMEFEKARKINPLKATYAGEIAQIDYGIGVLTRDKQYFNSGLKEIERSLILDNGNYVYYFIQAKLLLGVGEIGKGLKSLELAKQHAPWNKEVYEEIGYTNLLLAKYYLQKGNKEIAKNHLNEVIRIHDLIMNKVNSMDETAKRIQLKQYQLEVTKDLGVYISEARELQNSI